MVPGGGEHHFRRVDTVCDVVGVGSNRGDRHNRDMLIDSSLLGVDGTAELIESLARKVVENESKTEAGGDK